MVNSGSFDSADGNNRNGKTTRCGTQQVGDAALGSQSSDSADDPNKIATLESADGVLPYDDGAIEPTPTKTEINSGSNDQDNEFAGGSAIIPSLLLEKVEVVVDEKPARQTTRKLLCLYCDRTFVSANLRQKHVERVHSVKPNRRVSARRQNQQLCTTPCSHCDKLNTVEHTLSDLFQHLVQEHPAKYYGCISCEERFLNSFYLSEHNRINHFMDVTNLPNQLETNDNVEDTLKGSITRSKLRNRPEEPPSTDANNLPNNKKKKKSKLKDLRNKKISLKTSKIAIKRSTRLQQQAKEHEVNKKRKDKKFTNTKPETIINKPSSSDKSKTSINPYPEFDNFYRVKKITDHSIDNLKISSLTFDDVFDKAFFNRIKCNIEENLLHHIDGKLFKNEESESRISNFEKIPTAAQEIQNQNADNYGCEISLNAITPASALSLNSQFGEDFESQIEYGSKPSKKKSQIKSDEVHYKYFTRRKYQASILQQKENRDLSKLDMWTQMLVKERQEKMLDKKKSSKELQEYTSGQEYKSKIKREELNRILDRRGPFEDLKEEATKKAAFEKLNSSSENDISQEVFSDVREVLNDLLNRVFDSVKQEEEPLEESFKEIDKREIPAFLNLRRKTSSTQEEMDKSDKIALICSSQETENFELPTNTVRGKNEIIELTGEWARSRMYICAACGGKFSNMKYLLDHKSLYHQNVWVQHYEFVGNQSELYRHLSIPNLGKVGFVEETIPCKQQWKRSDARLCAKCGKQCNSLGELHRHLLECGGDWTWMLARKKCKYRPVGGKTRRKRKVFTGFEPKNPNKIKKTETTEKKILKKPMDGPRQRPSDADTIQRMLANLPAKRLRRNIISLSDVVFKSKKSNNNTNNNNTQSRSTAKVKRGNNKSQIEKNKANTRRSLRSFSKVLSSRILDINSSIMVKRKIKVLRSQRLTRNSKDENLVALEKVLSDTDEPQMSKKGKITKKDSTFQEESKIPLESSKKSIGKRILTSRLNLKNFFPVKKRNRSISKNLENVSQETQSEDTKSKFLENFEHTKKSKRGGLKGFVRGLSLRKRNSKDDEGSAITESIGKTRISRQKSKKYAEDNELESQETPKKRKLQQSFRKIINKVKKIKTTNKPIIENQAFLEQVLPQDSTGQETQVTIVSPVEIKENIQDKEDPAPTVTSLTDSENPPIPETIFNLAEKEEKVLQAKGFEVNKIDIPVCIDTSIKPKSLPLLSPNIKGKIRKPSRGLNDCIAMLTTKLQQKDDKLSLSRESLFSTSSTTSVAESRNLVDSFTTPIPIMPTITINECPMVETALDLSKKSVSSPDLSVTGKVDNLSWTSVDDIIQKVIDENTTNVVKLNSRTNLDDTIDFVVNNSLDWFEIRHSDIEDEKRKHYKKPRRKKHSDDDLITNIIFGKDKLIIAPSSNPEDDDPLIARIKENELKMSSANKQNSLTLPDLLVNPFLAAPFLPIFQPELLLKEFGESLAIEKPLDVVVDEVKQKEEFIAPTVEEDVKLMKKPPVRRKGRKTKPAIIETNIDDQMGIKEVLDCEPDIVTLPSEATIELTTENEPTVLENKIINKSVSDSEDEVPLAQIAKQEGTKEPSDPIQTPTKNDMVETLTTDSLKENIEAPKVPSALIDTKAPATVKKIRKKKRKKIFVKQKRPIKTSTKLDALLESKTNLPLEDVVAKEQAEEVANNQPTKILTSQRTRRKSKNSKKIDTVDNDLFKNFSLVINKKTKRIPPTSIVDDSVCDDINFFVKPLESIVEAKPDSSSENILNDSVEEMDMELEDLPVNSSIIIIERDASLLKEAYEAVAVSSKAGEKDEEPKVPVVDDVLSENVQDIPDIEKTGEDIPDIEKTGEDVEGLNIVEEVSLVEQNFPVLPIVNGESSVAKPARKRRGRPPKNPDKITSVKNFLEVPLTEGKRKRGRPRKPKQVTDNIQRTEAAEDASDNNSLQLSPEEPELVESIPELPVEPVTEHPQIPGRSSRRGSSKTDSEEAVEDVQKEADDVVEAVEDVEEIIDENKEDSIAPSSLEIELVKAPTVPKKSSKTTKQLKTAQLMVNEISTSASDSSSKNGESSIDSSSNKSEDSEGVKISPVKRRRGRPSKSQTKSKPDNEIFEQKVSTEVSSIPEVAVLPLTLPIAEAFEENLQLDHVVNNAHVDDIPELPSSLGNISDKDDIEEGTKGRRSRKIIDYNEDILEKRAIEISTLMNNQDKKTKRIRKNMGEPINQAPMLEEVELECPTAIEVDKLIINEDKKPRRSKKNMDEAQIESITCEALECLPLEEIPTKTAWEAAIICNVSEFSEIPKLVVDIHDKDRIEHHNIACDIEIDKNVALEEASSTKDPREDKFSKALVVYNFEETIIAKKAEKKRRRSRKSTNSEDIDDQNLVEDLVTLEQKLEALENESYSRYQRRSRKSIGYNDFSNLRVNEDKDAQNVVEGEPQDPIKTINPDLIESVVDYTEPIEGPQILNNNKSVHLPDEAESGPVKDVFEFEDSTSNKEDFLIVPVILNNNESANIELESEAVLKPKRGKTRRNRKNQNEDGNMINDSVGLELEANLAPQKAKGKRNRKNKKDLNQMVVETGLGKDCEDEVNESEAESKNVSSEETPSNIVDTNEIVEDTNEANTEIVLKQKSDDPDEVHNGRLIAIEKIPKVFDFKESSDEINDNGIEFEDGVINDEDQAQLGISEAGKVGVLGISEGENNENSQVDDIELETNLQVEVPHQNELPEVDAMDSLVEISQEPLSSEIIKENGLIGDVPKGKRRKRLKKNLKNNMDIEVSGISEVEIIETSQPEINLQEIGIEEIPLQKVDTMDTPVETSQELDSAEIIKENGLIAEAPKGKRRKRLKKNNMDMDVSSISEVENSGNLQVDVMESTHQNELPQVDAMDSLVEISQEEEIIKENGLIADAPRGKRRKRLKKNNMDIDVTNILDSSPRMRKSRNNISESLSNIVEEQKSSEFASSSTNTNQSMTLAENVSDLPVCDTVEEVIPDEEVVLETKSLPAPIKHKKRQTNKKTIDSVEADLQQQLAKINIKDLLLSSLAPPDSTYERDFSESKGKKPKNKKPKPDIIFEENSNNSLKNITTFDALKNVLNTITTTENMFSEIPPLSEIISSSEMDIAPVLDEIDKSLESEDIYDFNEDLKKSLKKKLKNKSNKKLDRKRSKSSGQNEQELLTIEKEVADILNVNNKEETEASDQNQLDSDGLELRRSRRESRKVASYNENDLIDPLIDALEKTRSRATRKDKSILVEKPKLSSEELFDLLKKSSGDNEVTNVDTTFFGQLDSSNGADQDLPSDIDSISGKTFIEPAKIQDPDKIYEFTEESPENTSKEVFPKKKKSLPTDTNENNYCEICKKSFIRIENLIKHKTTLTHISKLSELEAKEAEEKARLMMEKEAQEQLNLTNILMPSQVIIREPLPLQTNHSLKLVDIISDVLNKPVLENYQEAKESDVRRYKSLGERKSFDSEVNNTPYNMLPTTILEKQINLLENIIGNNLNKPPPENNYIDEISSCSNQTSNVSEIEENDNSCTTIFNINSDADFIKPPPTQYEEISEDSANARVYEDPSKQRKTLNRDEELFLECCSLLKSGSEVSNSIKNPATEPCNEPELMESKNLIQPVEEAHEYSDNSRTPTPLGDTFDDDASNSNTISSNWHLNSEKTMDKNPSLSFEEVKNKEAAGMSFGEILTKGLKNQFENVAKISERAKEDNNCQKDTLPEQSPTSDDRKDDSDAGSIASKKIATKGARKVYEGLRVSIPTEDLNLDVLNTSPLNKKCEIIKTPPPIIMEEQMSPSKPRSTRKSKPVKKSQVGSNLLFKVNKKRPMQADIYNFEETQDNADIFIKPSSKDINKKTTPIIASDNESLGYADSIGADAKSVSSLSSISAMSTKKPIEATTPEIITKKKSKIMGKIFKNAAKAKTDDIDEELRNIPEIPEIDNLELVENYVRSCQRVQSPFLPPPPPPAPLDQVPPKKPKMTEEEMNLLFDQLLGKDVVEQPEKNKSVKRDLTKRKNHNGNNKIPRHRKRARINSESSDEFNINKSAKKRTNKKVNHDDSGINMELELKECIGVASRKSQRTCTSGKQNILVEYWSSDEEAFEAMLESHKVPNIIKQPEEVREVFEKPLLKPKKLVKKPRKPKLTPKTPQEIAVATSNRRKRAAANPLYHWSSSSEDESQSLIEIKPIREEEDEDDRPVQHGWIVGDSPKKLVTMLALTKGKKTDFDSVKEQGKRRTSNIAS